jgi:gliding motility-associated protein GldM
MAGGKQSPRQKMINLMYLVFLAMMAMSMGKEVLAAFGLMNEKLSKANVRASEQNARAYESLALKAAEQAKQYGEAKEKTDALRAQAESFYAYIEDLKGKMTAGVEDKKDYQVMDKSDFLDSYFFESGTITPNGKEFVSKVDEFRKTALEVLGDTDLATVVESRFDTDPVKNREGLQLNWLNYNYEGFPLIASLTKLTQIQADIKTTESEALSSLLQGQMESAVSMTNYDAMVVFDKNAYYPGEKLSGKIVLGKNDPNLTAEKVVINGDEWPEDKIKAGQVILDGPAGGVGDREIKGSFFFKENDSLIEIPIKGGYSVIPRPNEAVISADKMNAVYRGLSNPMTISMPGVPSNKVSASAPGLKRVKGDSYMMRPGKGNEVTIRVTGTLPDGKKVSSNKKFRVKEIPPAVGMVRGQYGTVSMPKGSVGKIRVGAGLPDFLFDLKLNVSAFKIKVPGQVAIPVTGTGMNARAKQAINKARRGDQITIYDIQATTSGYKLKKVLPIVIKVSN